MATFGRMGCKRQQARWQLAVQKRRQEASFGASFSSLHKAKFGSTGCSPRFRPSPLWCFSPATRSSDRSSARRKPAARGSQVLCIVVKSLVVTTGIPFCFDSPCLSRCFVCVTVLYPSLPCKTGLYVCCCDKPQTLLIYMRANSTLQQCSMMEIVIDAN